jgi:outer membrane protein assembly factor BamD
MSTGKRPARWAFALFALGLVLLPGCHRSRRSDASNEALMARANDLLERRKFFDAVEVLGDVGLVEPVAEDLDPEYKLLLADAYFYQSGTVAAVEAQNRYEQFLGFYPLHAKAPYARYMVGVCLMNQADDPENDQEYSKRALQHFQLMLAGLPKDSPWLRPAKVMLVRAQDRLAQHEWIVAKFYIGREKWPGAIGRLSTMVDQYPGARRRGEALLELANAYKQVGDTAQSRLTIDRLLAEFPDGPLAERAQQLRRELPEDGVVQGARATGH